MTFHERKKERTEYYQKYVYGWKLKDCSACSGSGYYDDTGSPKCGGCDGTGKERYKNSVWKNNQGIIIDSWMNTIKI